MPRQPPMARSSRRASWRTSAAVSNSAAVRLAGALRWRRGHPADGLGW